MWLSSRVLGGRRYWSGIFVVPLTRLWFPNIERWRTLRTISWLAVQSLKIGSRFARFYGIVDADPFGAWISTSCFCEAGVMKAAWCAVSGILPPCLDICCWCASRWETGHGGCSRKVPSWRGWGTGTMLGISPRDIGGIGANDSLWSNEIWNAISHW